MQLLEVDEEEQTVVGAVLPYFYAIYNSVNFVKSYVRMNAYHIPV